MIHRCLPKKKLPLKQLIALLRRIDKENIPYYIEIPKSEIAKVVLRRYNKDGKLYNDELDKLKHDTSRYFDSKYKTFGTSFSNVSGKPKCRVCGKITILDVHHVNFKTPKPRKPASPTQDYLEWEKEAGKKDIGEKMRKHLMKEYKKKYNQWKKINGQR